MTGRSDDVRQAMEQAAAEMDFERAARLRDELALLIAAGGGAADEPVDIDTTGLTRQRPGAMGLGTSRQRMTPPPGWTPPPRPDPMTKGRSRRGSG